ncbi:hypothetical protein N0V83_006271 [Neocucurbitaria cava]|uniref:Heterokaryon incompatibility domain-containing protein n=1 Tax=Neocucurbitaria cava TaxID=798079 RepID=A0A9W8Y8I4_9PLEO|nr:hypothetical protein N0V83_006271 [Neocucurbitaria cava]
MRLLQLRGEDEFSLVDYHKNLPPYAILSHTWGADNEEVTFNDVTEDIGRAKNKEGYRKLIFCSKRAVLDGLRFFWIDTCCIDKSSSQELTEAINSMFQWYQNAERCYVYLSDVGYSGSGDTRAWEPAFKKSRWFTRGWTLQELIAPASVEFFSYEGQFLDTRHRLAQAIHDITGISVQALEGKALFNFSVDERMSWALKRETTREEDGAYCLLGIFNVYIPLIYGEGRENAFSRLEERIRKPPNGGPLPIDDKQRRRILDALRFEQIDARQMAIKSAHSKTCKWFLHKVEYQEWLNEKKRHEHHGFLWVKGKPGTGKSTLMKFALSNARDTMTDRIMISFFFNARGEDMEKSTIGLYRSLLLQLLERVPALQSVFDSLGTSAYSIGANFQWQAEALKTMLRQAILKLGELSVVSFIDALDECAEDQVRDMISFFEHISELTTASNTRFQICFSSRHYPHITIRKGIDLVLEGQEGHGQDITTYLESELMIGQSATAQQIRAELRRKAAGIFIWVVLVVGMLNKEYDSGRLFALRRTLQDIPSDLHELFRNILTRDSYNQKELILCIQWVLFALHPLTPEQLYFAILSGVEPGLQSHWDPAEVPKDAIERFILNSSKGLAEVTTFPVPRVQFIHESVKDFLLKKNYLATIWPAYSQNFEGQSHEQLKICCLQSVESHFLHSEKGLLTTYNPWGRDSSQTSEIDEIRLSFPFLDYAVMNILYHADLAERGGATQAQFLRNFPLAVWVRLSNLLVDQDRFTEQVTLLYVLAHHNASHLIKIHPSNLQYLALQEERCGTPLFAAISAGSEETVQAFIDVHTATCPPESWLHHQQCQFTCGARASRLFPGSFTITNRRSILSYLAELGESVIFALALQGPEVLLDERDADDGLTPLSHAAARGFGAIVRILLETGKVNADTQDHQGRTPLLHAVSNGHNEEIKMLLGLGKANVNLQDKMGRTPLILASGLGNKSAVEILLKTEKANVNLKDKYGRPALMHAIVGIGATIPIIKILLQAGGTEVDVPDDDGRTPLLFAAKNRRTEHVARLLLGTNMVDINRKDNLGRTALSYAAERGNVAMVRLLLEQKGIDSDSKDKRGRSPLAWAQVNGSYGVASILESRLSTVS